MVTLDVALTLPVPIRRIAVDSSHFLADRMEDHSNPSHFRLGEPFPGLQTGSCEPHVSLFMLWVGENEVAHVMRAVQRLALERSALSVRGERYGSNSCGATEIYFQKSPEWEELQAAVIGYVEPLRQGRVRRCDPAGVDIAALIRALAPNDPRRRQLEDFGYDEVVDTRSGGIDRFHPHVTLAWPRDAKPLESLADLPAPSAYDGILCDLAVFGMSPYGTCTREYGRWSLAERP
ncbi:MAG: hypothetical protein ACRD3Q_18950 [Terriglobales bacterium]